MKYIYKTLTLIALFFFVSCNDYLDIDPKGFVIPNEVRDFDIMLNGSNYTIHTTTDEDVLFLTADDFQATTAKLGDIANPDNRKLKLYTWASNLFSGTRSQSAWNKPYANIFTYNTVLEGVYDAPLTNGYVAKDKNRIAAEAKVGRAYEYWLLVNTFAKHFNKATASSDLGVPLITKPRASALDNPPRASIQEVYDFIINDVEDAIPHLPSKAINNVRPSKTTAYGFLARFYLSIGNYEKALENATLAINLHGTIGDYTGSAYKTEYLKDQYLTRFFGYSRGFNSGFLSEELVNIFDKKDARLNKIAKADYKWKKINGKWTKIYSGYYRNALRLNVNHSVSAPEMYVIRAECNARLASGNIANVIADLNTIRIKRFSSADYKAITTADLSDKTKALKFALEERRRELFLTGIRLFDLKRLNLEPAFAKSVTHTVEGIDYTQNAGANNLVLPIPAEIFNFNSSLVQNPRD